MRGQIPRRGRLAVGSRGERGRGRGGNLRPHKGLTLTGGGIRKGGEHTQQATSTSSYEGEEHQEKNGKGRAALHSLRTGDPLEERERGGHRLAAG